MALDLEHLLDLEMIGWRSLCDGTGSDVYGSMMTEQARMVLADGTVMSRDDVVSSLRYAPPWASFEIDDPRLVPIDDRSALLIYRGTGHRDDGSTFTAVMTSVYVEHDVGTRLAHYQQTPVS